MASLLVNWDLFESLDELLSLIRCFTPNQLHSLCKYMSQNFRYCRSGGPDLVVWSVHDCKVKFVEVKGPGDKLSFKQMIWLDFMVKAGIDCEVCHVKGKNSKRLREIDQQENFSNIFIYMYKRYDKQKQKFCYAFLELRTKNYDSRNLN